MLLDSIVKKKTLNQDLSNINSRNKIGILAAFIGIITNAILIIIKLTIGLIINSVSVVANAIDSLSDFSSNIITIIGFKLSKKPADREHPFGHQRIEYVSGLIVSMLICFIGASVLFTSIKKMINYEIFSISKQLFIVTLIIIGITIVIKLYQFYSYNKLSKLIKSSNLHDNAIDSLTDIISSIILIIGLSINYILMINNVDPHFSIDGLLGIIEALIIIISGIKLVKEEIDYIIGKPTDKDYVKKIVDFINSYEKILGTHDVICHMYGPEMCYMTCHVEVDENSNFKEIDIYTERIEEEVFEKFHVYLTIHMDLTNLSDPKLNLYSEKINNILMTLSSELSFHDLRIINHRNKTVLVFDVLVPFNFKLTNNQIEELLKKGLNDDKIVLEITYDHSYEE